MLPHINNIIKLKGNAYFVKEALTNNYFLLVRNQEIYMCKFFLLKEVYKREKKAHKEAQKEYLVYDIKDKGVYRRKPLSIYFLLTTFENGEKLSKYIKKGVTSLFLIHILFLLSKSIKIFHDNCLCSLNLKSENIIMRGSTPIIVNYECICIDNVEYPKFSSEFEEHSSKVLFCSTDIRRLGCLFKKIIDTSLTEDILSTENGIFLYNIVSSCLSTNINKRITTDRLFSTLNLENKMWMYPYLLLLKSMYKYSIDELFDYVMSISQSTGIYPLYITNILSNPLNTKD